MKNMKYRKQLLYGFMVVAVFAVFAAAVKKSAQKTAVPSAAAKAPVLAVVEVPVSAPRARAEKKDFTRGYPRPLRSQVCAVETAGVIGRFYSDGKRQSGQFALTFDDGPGPTTPELLEVLAKNNAKSTFFMLGDSVKKFPKYAAAVAEGGHLLGNHTYSHANFNKLPEGQRLSAMEGEICKTEAAVRAATGQTTYFLRAPYGLSSQWIRELAGRKGYVMVNWSCGADWWFHPREQILKQYLDNLHSGAVFLLHDGGSSKRETTVWLVERILAEAKKRGLKPVRLDELLTVDPAALARERAKLPGRCGK